MINNENVFRTQSEIMNQRYSWNHLKIFIVKGRKYYLYDELNSMILRYADVAEDAHSMDLEYHRHKDFKLYFVRTYVSRSRDHDLIKILNFLICYKAFMRAKVSLFQATFESTRARQHRLKKEADLLLAFGQRYLTDLE
jgi:aminoglycoside phosphotransferase family enzyme